jgi:hypothetical protein
VPQHRFEPAEWQSCAISEQIYRCRVFADAARRLSICCLPHLSRAYGDLAAAWSMLAAELEKTLP